MVHFRNPLSISKRLLISLLLTGLLTACQAPAEVIPTETPVPTATPAVEDVEARFLENIETVSLNDIGLADTSAAAYRFLVSGHIYGSFEEGAPHPAVTLMESLPELEARGLSLMVFLGDIVRHATLEDHEDLEQDLVGQVDYPVINAVGNHDMRDRDLYESRYGMTYYAFQYGPSAMIVLDTELDVCQIPPPQQEMLQQAVEKALEDPQIEQIFVFLHKALFANDEVLYTSQSTLAMPNEWKCYDDTNYVEIVERILLPAAAVKPVFVLAGDVGATGGNLSPFYRAHEDAALTEVAVGIGDKPQDAVLLVSVEGAQVEFELLSLTGQTMRDLTAYDLAYWQDIAQK